MSFADLLSPESQTAALPALPYNPTGFADVAAAAFDDATFRQPFGRVALSEADAAIERKKLVHERFGQDANDLTGMTRDYPETFAGNTDELDRRLDALITEGREADPDKWQGIRTMAEIRAATTDQAQASRVGFEDTAARAPAVPRIAGSLAGGIAGAFTDPINLATLPLGAGAGMGILRAAVAEGLINAGIEAAEAPLVAQWQRELGFKYGLEDAAFDVATAGAGGATLTTVLRGAGPAFRAAGSVGMRVLDRIGRTDALPAEARGAAQYLSRVAHIDENLPPLRDAPTHDDLATHREAVWETQEALRANREPEYRMAELERRLDAGVPATERASILAEMDRLADEAIRAKGLPVPQQPRNTDAPAFTAWFGASQATDEAGQPLVVYHGTNADIAAFDTARASDGDYGKGFYFTDSADAASMRAAAKAPEGRNVVPAYLSLQNPLRVGSREYKDLLAREGLKDTLTDRAKVAAAAQRAGYDGIVAPWKGGRQFVAFRPEQVKSKFNPGTFDPADPRLLDAGPAADLATRPSNPAASLKQAAEDTRTDRLADTALADFARLVRDQPDMTLLVDGRQTTLREITDWIEEGETIMAAIKTCGLG